MKSIFYPIILFTLLLAACGGGGGGGSSSGGGSPDPSPYAGRWEITEAFRFSSQTEPERLSLTHYIVVGTDGRVRPENGPDCPLFGGGAPTINGAVLRWTVNPDYPCLDIVAEEASCTAQNEPGMLDFSTRSGRLSGESTCLNNMVTHESTLTLTRR